MKHPARLVGFWQGGPSASVVLTVALVSAALVFALALSAGTGAAAKQAADTLQVNAVFGYSPPGQPPSRVACPTGVPSTDQCFQFSGHAAIRGLGQVTDSFMLTTADDSLACVPLSFTPVVITVGSKGEIDATVGTSGPCDATATTFTITGGTGAFAGVSGAGMFTPNVGLEDDHYIDADDPPDWTHDTWTGTLTVPAATLDITPPVISGGHAKAVVAPKNANSARVLYTVTARDDTDGPVPVTCKPPSGSHFKIGHTTVHCSATDSSANTATTRFVVTVKRR
jgi:hypothetical protein